MRNITFLAITAWTLCLIACNQTSQNNKSTDVPGNWKALNETDYSIQYPDSFELDKSGQMGLSFILLSRQTSDQDLFRENINLLVQNLGGHNVNLDKYVEISIDQLNTVITDGKLLDSRRLKGDGSEYHQVVFSGKQGQFDLKWQQLYWIRNNKAYVLTLTCEASQYDNYVDIGKKVLNTFRIK